MQRADQLARLKQGPQDAKSVPPLGQTAGVGSKQKRADADPWKVEQLAKLVLSFRRAQTFPACSPVPVALLGHATRPGMLRG
ncbi:MAG: hypothetical protein H0X47_15545 [Nitrospirales bacterium]|nr:hypothetical protein [Nitrospirales bacterium]